MSLYILNLLCKIRSTCTHIFWAFLQHLWRQWLSSHHFVLTRVRLQCSNCCHQYCSIGNHARNSALDIEKSFSTHVCTKAGLCNQIVTEMNSQFVCNDRRVPSCNVSEWSRMNKRWGVFQRLHQVWFDGISQNDSHCTSATNLLCSHSNLFVCVSHNDASKTRTQVFHRRRKRK